MKRFIFHFCSLIILLSTTAVQTSASDFSSNGMEYNILSEEERTVEFARLNDYDGDLSIPEQITHNGTTYTVTAIRKFAFYGSSLTSIEIPETVTVIGEAAFGGCSNLTSITIPNSVTMLEEMMFVYCSSLTSITLPNTITTIGKAMFGYCTNLRSVTIPNSVTTIGNQAFFECNKLESVEIPNTVTAIGERAFAYCPNLTTVTIPNTVTVIEDMTFNHCSSLTSVTIPSSVTTIGDTAFGSCSSLTSIQIPNSVTEIKDLAFSHCSSLNTITIPSSVTTIGGLVFYGCSNLTDIVVDPENQAYCSIDGVLYDKEISYLIQCSQQKKNITIPQSVTTIDALAFLFGSLIDIEVDPENQAYCSIDGVLYDKEISLLIQCPQLKEEITIPETVTTIGERAFCDCSNLTSVTIPNSVTTIEELAFMYCSGLTSLEIPDSVTEIGFAAFSYCSGLTSITIPNSVTTIGERIFYDCRGLTAIYCKIIEPYSCYLDIPEKVLKNATLYVPKGCKSKYEMTASWNGFEHIEEMDYSGIGDIMANRTIKISTSYGMLSVEDAENGGFITVYDMKGRIVYRGAEQTIRLQPGVYIVECRNERVKVAV